MKSLRTPAGVLVALVVCLWALAAARQLPPAIQEMDARLAQLAAEAATRGPATPIPLQGEGGRILGAVYDQYLIGVAVGRAMIAAGGTPDAVRIAEHEAWRSRATVVIAYPVDCTGRPNQPTAIKWQTQMKGPVAASIVAGPMKGGEARALVPGVALPDEALVVSFRNASTVGGSVAIDYAGPVCRGAATTAVLPLVPSPSMELGRGFNGVKLPAEFSTLPSPTTVRVRVTTDAAGRARFPEPAQGPAELAPTAIAMLNARTFAPSTVNGVPVPLNMVVTFVFTATGEPGQAAPYATAPPPGGGTVMYSNPGMVMTPAPTTPKPVPPAPPGQFDQQLARLAAELAQKGDPTPVPLDAAGPATHGVAFDRFLMGVVKARAAIRAGTPIDPASAPASLVAEDLVVVAFPISCDARKVIATDVQVFTAGTSPGPWRQTSSASLSGATLAQKLPGVTLPDGAVGRTFAPMLFSQNLEVRVTYSEPACSGDQRTRTLPIQWVRGQSLPRQPAARLPEGSTLASPTEVRVRGIVDPDGAYRFPNIAEGPAELGVTTATVASQWRFNPYRANGVATPIGVVTTLVFTASGMPEPAQPGAPPGPPPAAPPGGTPPIVTSSSVGGKLPTTTPDEAGLSRATSKCDVAGDAEYGLTVGGAIKIGGGPMDGPPRARKYLAALRGPAGQGLTIVRRGATVSASGGIVDVYEITYAGATAPIRVYVDQYADGPLMAPQGLVCAAPVK